MRLPLYQVDAFTTRRFRGNPAAVVPLDAWLDDRLLLDIAAENVEDADNNITRFVVLSKEKSWAPRQDDRLMMTTFVFRVHNIPAALYKAMGGFATNGVNMTKLESYQLGGKFFSTQFYADIEGHPDDKNAAQALKELNFFSREVRILGVYDAHPFRVAQGEDD